MAALATSSASAATAAAATIFSTSPSPPLSIFSPTRPNDSSSARFVRFLAPSKKSDRDSGLRSDSGEPNLLPVLSNRTLSKDVAMGLVLSAASVRGWTTDSGMEGPVAPTGAERGSGTERVSTFPWSLFTKSPRRRMRVAFTCNVCGQRTTRAINPHAYTDGTVFVQCCGCNIFHKLVDNLNLFHEMKCYVNPSFNYKEPKWDVGFNYLNITDDDGDETNDVFPI
ncbi:hypothetical protein BT93_G0380 [Corymbia citriodora subsp. variegata]|nr:hypothetical protein BT93_G0380 [Corymbia citriodora subsp. variegata]